MKRAFTLIELSIVLIIIGLLVGGVLAGREIIQSAKISATVSDLNQLRTAINTFELKYESLPGDMDDATLYWPDDSLYTGYETWDGNDNRTIDWGNYESFRVFQHFSSSGIIPGNYVGANADTPMIAGVHIMPGQFEGAGYYFQSDFISLGTQVSGNPRRHDDFVLTPVQAQKIDRKFDDGLAQSGVYWGFDEHGTPSDSTDGGCLTVNSLAGEYDLSKDAPACRTTYFY